MLESLCEDEESRQEEYRELSLILTPVLTYLSSTDPDRHTLVGLLDSIWGEGEIAANLSDPDTLPLPF
jgi:hypothetical protein